MNPKCLNFQSIEFILRLYFSMKFNIIIYIMLLYIILTNSFDLSKSKRDC